MASLIQLAVCYLTTGLAGSTLQHVWQLEHALMFLAGESQQDNVSVLVHREHKASCGKVVEACRLEDEVLGVGVHLNRVVVSAQ